MSGKDVTNRIAIGLAEQVRNAMEDELVGLETDAAKADFRYDELCGEAEKARELARTLQNDAYNKRQLLASVDKDIRDLKRGREGHPFLSDDEYEERMRLLRNGIQEMAESLNKQAAWAE